MKITTRYKLLALLLFPMSLCAQTNNAELQKMYNEDQTARMVKNIDWAVLSKKDKEREARVYDMIKAGEIVTGKDYYNSAMIFQHGNDTSASAMAVKQMKKAIELDSNINRWLLAAAIDRDLMRRGKPQIYGTQYVKNGAQAKWKRYQIDTTKVTDAERKYYRVETLAEQVAKERSMNLTTVSDYFAKPNSIENTLVLINDEFKKGNNSTYDVSESGVNTFAYQLMNANKNEEALKVFKLNTELYPNGFNAFDSYGECLLKLNKKKDAIKAYKKSLELNPKNDNAKKVIEENN